MTTTNAFHHEDFTGNINVAVGDINGDNFYDIVLARGAGGRGLLEAFDGKTLEGLVRSGAINSLSATGVAHETAVFHQDVQPYGPNYTGEIKVTSGYALQTPETPNGAPVQTSSGNITTLALGEVPEGHEQLKIHTFIAGHGGHGGHDGDSEEEHGGHGEHGEHGGHAVVIVLVEGRELISFGYVRMRALFLVIPILLATLFLVKM
ncbi:MAG: hypothetical protein IGQ45_10520 [Cyanobacterium sp. T60_A2020_053]|nr:hypothetical protein [Cyanobacterium sp. T60_A2020_053]